MKLTSRSSFLFGSGVALLLIAGACSDNISNCEERLTCSTGGSSSSGDGDSDGDGDGDGTGGEDPNGSGGEEGDGDGDTTTDTETGGGTTGDGDGDEQCLPALCPDGYCDGADCLECVHGDDEKFCKDSDKPVCLEDNTCAECASNDDCTDPEASVCDTESNQCVACTDNDGCSHLDDATLCDTERNVCIECTSDAEVETDKCGDKSCDPATNTCTDTDTNSVETCEACVADSECKSNHHCVPMEYKGEARGGYCLKTNEEGCVKPYSIDINGRVTLSGASGETYCGINESLSTCEAVLALADDQECDDSDDECPEGGLCRKVGSLTPNRCTYECDDPVQCKPGANPGSTCDYGTPPATGGATGSGGGSGTGGQKYCGG